jgi:hypothetical protein
MAFGLSETGVLSFDKYVLIDRIISLGTEEEKELSDTLKQKYVSVFLKKIIDKESIEEQKATLESDLDRLPSADEQVQEFLSRLRDIAPEYIQKMLE